MSAEERSIVRALHAAFDDHAMSDAARTRIEARVRAAAAEGAPVGRPRWRLRPVLILVVVLLLAMSSVATAASRSALPGEPLYAVKPIAERIESLVAFSQERRAELALVHAGRRLDEAESVEGEARARLLDEALGHLDRAAELGADPAEVTRLRDREGSLRAASPEPGAPAATPSPTPTRGQPTPSSRSTPSESASARPSRSPAPRPTTRGPTPTSTPIRPSLEASAPTATDSPASQPPPSPGTFSSRGG